MWNEFTLLYSEEVSFTFNYSIGYFYLDSKLYSSETYFFNVVAISWAIFLIRYDSLVHITHHLEKKKNCTYYLCVFTRFVNFIGDTLLQCNGVHSAPPTSLDWGKGTVDGVVCKIHCITMSS